MTKSEIKIEKTTNTINKKVEKQKAHFKENNDVKNVKEAPKENKKIKKIFETEEQMQIKEGINGELPDIVYNHKAISDSTSGICPFPSVYEKNYQKNVNKWREKAKNELKKIDNKLTDDATNKEIDHLFKQFLYVSGYDYPVIEPIERFSYVVFKNDMKDPFTNKAIEENININLEIALDCSGSMGKVINGETMMDIAKNSIIEVIEKMPKNAKVGLRVFGHKGNNNKSGKVESCNSCELIKPILTVSKDEINNALQPITPTGWTCIAKSIEEGAKDLSQFKDKKDLNILFIITDGIETCAGNPAEIAKKFFKDKTNIVLGIIGFNVDRTQNMILKQITDAGSGYYASAKDASELTSELETIHEIAYSNYKWEIFNNSLYNMVKGY